jgi:hypothetical protein
VSVPVGFTTFPGEIWAAPRSWVETVYPGLAYFNEADRGGHFAAWEEPAPFASGLRAAFKPLRSAAPTRIEWPHEHDANHGVVALKRIDAPGGAGAAAGNQAQPATGQP